MLRMCLGKPHLCTTDLYRSNFVYFSKICDDDKPYYSLTVPPEEP